MEIRQLRYFVTVARTRHFGQAAERLHMNQSPLSQAIRQLESQIGATLFTRTTRKVDLTPAGEALLRDALRILESVGSAQERVQQIAEGRSGLVRVGSTGLAAYKQLPQLARIVAREAPGIVLKFVPDLLTPASESALTEDRIDVALLRPPVSRTGLVTRPIAREKLVAAVPDRHRLAGAGPVGLGELRDEPFVVYAAKESVVASAVTEACLAAGFLPHRAHEVAETSVMLTLVAAGLGIALLPESVLALRIEGVRFVGIADDASVDLALAWRADDDAPAIRTLVSALEDNGFVSPTDTPPTALDPVPGGHR
ncbi:LysR substrate-binding domain-containing protein [Pseudonocardia phyllosphaerae]|uniref:LysR substrate-binding domain-containing protein n=1 Tax=Pseudonocardia phyllosphaerae TaxID=3390502 RepID=UPI003978DBEC